MIIWRRVWGFFSGSCWLTNILLIMALVHFFVDPDRRSFWKEQQISQRRFTTSHVVTTSCQAWLTAQSTLAWWESTPSTASLLSMCLIPHKQPIRVSRDDINLTTSRYFGHSQKRQRLILGYCDWIWLTSEFTFTCGNLAQTSVLFTKHPQTS